MWWFITIAHAVSLDAAIQAAEHRSPGLEVAAEHVHAAEEQVHEARAHLLPSASVSAAMIAQKEVTVNLADNLPDIPLLDPDSLEPLTVVPGFQVQAAAEVTQPLVAPQAWATGSAARAGVRLARAEEEASRERLRHTIVRAWHASAESHARVEDARAGVDLAERLLERARAMVEHGTASEDQILPFRRAVAVALANRAIAEEARTTADGVLRQLTGLEGGADPSVPPSEPPPLEALLDALERSDLVVAETRVEAARVAQTVERRALIPTLAAKGGVYLVDPAPDLGTTWNWRVQLGTTIPLFQGGATRARISGAGARVAQAEAASRMAREQAQLEVRTAHGALCRALAAMSAREEALALAEDAVRAAEARSALGGGSLLAIQQAQAEEVTARAELTRARSDAARAADELQLAARGAVY